MDDFEGKMIVEFTNGDFKTVDVDHNIIDATAHPIYLVDVNGRYYNWMNIISVKKNRKRTTVTNT